MEIAALNAATLSEPQTRERFGCPDWLDATYRCTGRPPIRVVEGSLSLDALVANESVENVVAFVLIVDGDLYVSGDIDLLCGDRNVLVVMGSLRARNLRLGSTHLFVEKDVHVSGCLVCHPSEEAVIHVKGALAARLATLSGEVSVDARMTGLVMCDDDNVRFRDPVDIVEPADVLVEELIIDEEGELDVDELWDFASTGAPVLR
jgi:hypothetical protein